MGSNKLTNQDEEIKLTKSILVAMWQQIITFKIKIDTIRRIENKRWFEWRLETNEIMITSVKVGFKCWTCSQHGEMNGKKTQKWKHTTSDNAKI